MAERKLSPLSRRSFLKTSVAASAMLGLGAPRVEALQAAAAAAGIRSREWITLPLNNGRTVEAGPNDLGGDLQLGRNPDGSYQASRTFESAVQRTRGRFNMVGMRWAAHVPPETTIAVEVRGSLDGNRWSAWAKVGHVMEAREDRANASADETWTDAVEMGRANVMQYRITLTTSNPNVSPTVRRVTATQIDSLDSPSLADLDSRGRAIPFRVGNGGPPTARLILRDGPNGWGPGFDASTLPVDDPLYWDPVAGVYPTEFVTIHHTAGANNPENPVATVRAVWYFHAVTLGWGDIGYHYLVDQYGNVYQGREGGHATEGGHVFRYNHHNIGVCLLGQFQPGATDVPYPGGEPTAQALDSATRMAALQAAYWGWNPLEQHAYPKPGDWCRPQLTNYRVCGHRDWGRDGSCVATACPGDNVYKHLPAMRERAAALLPQIKDQHLMQILKKG
jgi:hypothetical protein